MSERREYCFICGKIDKENDIALFRVPSGKLEDWQKQICRPGLRKSSLLCEVHFEDSEIDRGPVIQNELHRAPRRHLISKNVIPTQHLESKYYTVSINCNNLNLFLKCVAAPDFHTPKRKRQPLKPRLVNIGAPAGTFIIIINNLISFNPYKVTFLLFIGGPRVRSNTQPVKRPKSQILHKSLAAAAASTLFLESPLSDQPRSQLECGVNDSSFCNLNTNNLVNQQGITCLTGGLLNTFKIVNHITKSKYSNLF